MGVRSRWRTSSCAAAGALWLLAATARAQTTLVLSWNAPPSCPDHARAQAAITSLVPDGPLAPIEADVEIASEEDGGFTLVVQLHTPGLDEERRLAAATCDGAASAAIAIVALAASRAIEHSEPSAAIEQPIAPAVIERPPQTGTRVMVELGAGAVMDTSTLPSVAFGVSIAGGLAYDAFSARIAGTWYPAQEVGVTDAIALRSEWLALELIVRLAYEDGAFAIGGAFGGSLNAVFAEARGEVESVRASALFGRISIGPFARWTFFDPLALEAAVDLAIPLPSYRFVIDGLGTVHDPAPVSLTTRLGLALRW